MATLAAKYKGYPAYRPSGIDWLGDVPVHWEVAPVYARYEVALGKMLDTKRISGESLGPYVRNVDVQWDSVNTDDLPQMDFSEQERERYLLRPGDLLVCEGGEVGRTAIWQSNNRECFYQKAIHRVRPRSQRDVPRFFYYLMYSVARRGIFLAGVNPNTIPHLTAVQLRRYRFPFPPKSDQRAIADFLDRETARIDGLVVKKERLIELLQEKRVALITRAVTRGLDPDAPMKDSGVEWLGEIPAHWEVKRLKTIAEIRYGLGQPPKESPDGLPLIRATNVYRGHITDADMLYVDPEDIPTGRRASLSAGEIIVVRSGAYTADSAIIPKKYDGAIAGYDMVVTVREAKPEFVAIALLSPYIRDAQLVVASTRSAQPHLNAEELGDALILLPPIQEQRAIAGALDRETTKLDSLIAKIREAIERLREFRGALVSAAVTGRIDVREEVGCN